MDEVELLLLVVEVKPRLVAGGDHDRVDAERLDAQLAADLAKAVALAEPVQRADREALALDDLVHLFAHAPPRCAVSS